MKELIDSKSNNVSGWSIVAKNGVWNNERSSCSEWYGWNHPENGTISTTFNGKGHALLEFRNCNEWSDPFTINVILDGSEIAKSHSDTKQETHETVNIGFHYHDGSKLEITEIGKGIIELTKLEITYCEPGIFLH